MSGKSVDPDQTPRSAASDLDLHCLLRPVCPNTYESIYGNNTLQSKCGSLEHNASFIMHINLHAMLRFRYLLHFSN